jgi:hypothetical protein
MAGLEPAIQFPFVAERKLDGRVKPAHGEES